MSYFVSFLEGAATFVSPCLLPMLPLYLSYFAGDRERGGAHTLKNALGFILGFTAVFLALGAFAGTIGRLLRSYQLVVNIVTGGIVVLFGLHYLGVLRIAFLDRTRGANVDVRGLGFLSSMLFGIAFSISWTPCVGVFLGSALMLASQQGSVLRGMHMLLCYSLGLGIPFLISAVLVERLKATFDAVKSHMGVITKVSGALLVLTGIAMMTGTMGYLLSALSL